MTSRNRVRQRPHTVHSYARLQGQLVLLAWLHERLGFTHTRDVLSDVSSIQEGFDADGRSHVCQFLKARSTGPRALPPADLERYDDNIRAHLSAMNQGRREKITLRYFQYLAALYAEVFLDWRANRRAQLLESLNDLVNRRNANRLEAHLMESPFSESDLHKLAFWMATGSGKTLIMHLNYRQFLRYNREPLSNCLLITPNEELSEQHVAELMASNIRAVRFDLNETGSLDYDENTLRVTEITKLVEEKRGGGVKVPVEAFEGNNLVFVDEGHKGSGGKAWRGLRDALGETGFTFEYSATFGQALAAAGNEDLTAEYGKAIAFDYSYSHFYDDGYGKDFHIINLQEETTEELTDTLLMANLLSFYEQQVVFAEQEAALRPYMLDRPLWVFVGSSVKAVRTERKQKRSDVLTVARFMHRALSERRWAVRTVRRLLKGESGLIGSLGEDVFDGKFSYLKQAGTGAAGLYDDILRRVFHAPTGGGLRLCGIRSSKGEIGLRAAGAEEYFGLIYVGDDTAFLRLAQDDDGIVVEEDAISDSLFEGINGPDTRVEVLIGARKFTEGWNSWRVSNMGLLHVGSGEGPQIIQLFGRGVRLRGMDMGLRRSSSLDGDHPEYIKLLETLNIFSLRANYMAQFREYLEREGIETNGMYELPLFIKPTRAFLNKGLLIPRPEHENGFAADSEVLLAPSGGVGPVSVDMSAHVSVLASAANGAAAPGFAHAAATSGVERTIPPESLSLVDWGGIYLDLLRYKEQKGFDNLVVSPHAPRQIIEAHPSPPVYRLTAEEEMVRPRRADELERLSEAIARILRKYTDALYRRERRRWESDRLVYKKLDEWDPNFRLREGVHPGAYVVGIDRAETELITAVKRLIDDCLHLQDRDADAPLPRIHFDRHLYQPLLLEGNDKVKLSPPGLNEGERKFVKDLRDFWADEHDGAMAGMEVFLLRNQGKGVGVGFFENEGFYPDFILWIKNGDDQRVVFIEPHGMMQEKAYAHDDKARLHERLPDIAQRVAERSEIEGVTLDSYIVSATPYPGAAQAIRRWDAGAGPTSPRGTSCFRSAPAGTTTWRPS